MSSKSFAFPADASMDEVEELVGQGLDAMSEACYAGNEEASIVFGKEYSRFGGFVTHGT
jgi:hypothetical protein